MIQWPRGTVAQIVGHRCNFVPRGHGGPHNWIGIDRGTRWALPHPNRWTHRCWHDGWYRNVHPRAIIHRDEALALASRLLLRLSHRAPTLSDPCVFAAIFLPVSIAWTVTRGTRRFSFFGWNFSFRVSGEYFTSFSSIFELFRSFRRRYLFACLNSRFGGICRGRSRAHVC